MMVRMRNRTAPSQGSRATTRGTGVAERTETLSTGSLRR